MVFWNRERLLGCFPVCFDPPAQGAHITTKPHYREVSKSGLSCDFLTSPKPLSATVISLLPDSGVECIIAAPCLQSNYSLIWLVAQQDAKGAGCQAGSEVSHYSHRLQELASSGFSGRLFLAVGLVCSCVCVSRWLFGWKHGLFPRCNIPVGSLASCFLIKGMATILKGAILLCFPYTFQVEYVYEASLKY